MKFWDFKYIKSGTSTFLHCKPPQNSRNNSKVSSYKYEHAMKMNSIEFMRIVRYVPYFCYVWRAQTTYLQPSVDIVLQLPIYFLKLLFHVYKHALGNRPCDENLIIFLFFLWKFLYFKYVINMLRKISVEWNYF